MGLFDNLFKSKKDKILEKNLMETSLGIKFYQGWSEIGYALNNIVYRGRFGSYNCREVGKFDERGYVYSGYHKIGRVERNNIYLDKEIIGRVKGKYCVSTTGDELFKADKENNYAIGAALLLLFDIQPKEQIEETKEDFDSLEDGNNITQDESTTDEIIEVLKENNAVCCEGGIQVSYCDNYEEIFKSKTIEELVISKDWYHLTRELVSQSSNLDKKQKIEYLFAAFFVDVAGIDEFARVMTIDCVDTGNYLMSPIKEVIKEYELSDDDINSIFVSSKIIKKLSQELQFFYFDIKNCAKLLTILSKEKGPLYTVEDKAINYNIPSTKALNYTFFDFDD